MKVGRQARKDGKALFRACLKDNGALDEVKARTVVEKVLADKPRGYLAILSHFHKLVRLKLAERTATITTPDPLTEEQAVEYRNAIQSGYGQDMIVEMNVDPSLIGGARVQIGSDIYDASIKGRLNSVAQAF